MCDTDVRVSSDLYVLVGMINLDLILVFSFVIFKLTHFSPFDLHYDMI